MNEEMNEELKNEIISKKISINELNREQLKDIGFGIMDEENTALLIPLWAFPFIPDGTELISIFGDIEVKGEDCIDLDERFGYISYGLNCV